MSHSKPDYLTDLQTKRRAIDRIVTPLQHFMKLESAGGVVLVLATVVALVAANSPLAHAWHELWTGFSLQLQIGSYAFPSGKHAGQAHAPGSIAPLANGKAIALRKSPEVSASYAAKGKESGLVLLRRG